jgi:dihydroorotate dehydrogenase (NAD+) catalytic subunit
MAGEADLSVQLGPLRLANPIVAAAGTFGYGTEFEAFSDARRLGAIVSKTLTVAPRAGNPAPRIVETPSGMLNAVGLENVGIDAFFREKWPALKALGVPVIVSVAGFSDDEFVSLVRQAQVAGVSAIELNLSCPNVAHGPGARCFAQSAEDTGRVVRKAKDASALPIFAKLSPEVADLPKVARAAADAGADALSLINTLAGMVIDPLSEKPVLANGTGGLSGPALHPVAVRCVWEVRQAVPTPILGLGGVLSGKDALELMLAGASAVGIGTASFWNPRAAWLVLEELERLIQKKGVAARALVGRAQAKIA